MIEDKRGGPFWKYELESHPEEVTIKPAQKVEKWLSVEKKLNEERVWDTKASGMLQALGLGQYGWNVIDR